MSAYENIDFAFRISGYSYKGRNKRILECLKTVGLANRAKHRPGELSGGEQQRVAIARAIVMEPTILLADEPTGNLDPHTAEIVFGMLMTLVRETGLASLIATHNPELARQMDRVVTLRDGHLIELDPAELS